MLISDRGLLVREFDSNFWVGFIWVQRSDFNSGVFLGFHSVETHLEGAQGFAEGTTCLLQCWYWLLLPITKYMQKKELEEQMREEKKNLGRVFCVQPFKTSHGIVGGQKRDFSLSN